MAGPPQFKIPLEDDYNIEQIYLSFDCVSDTNNEVELEFSELSCFCVAKYEDYTLKLTSTQVDAGTPEVVCSVNEDRDKLYWLDMPPISSVYTHDNYFNEKIKIEIFTKAGGFTNKNAFGRGSIELLPLLLDIRNYGQVSSTARIVFNDGTGKSTEFNFTLKVKNPVLFQQLYDGYFDGNDVIDSNEELPLYVIPIPPKPDVRIVFDNTPEKVTLVDSVYDIYKQRKNFWLEKEDSVGKYYTNIIDNKNYRIRGSSHFFKVTYCGYRPLGLKLSCKTGICVIEETVPDSIADTLGCFIPRQVVIEVNGNDTTGLTIEKVTELVRQYYTQLELLIFDPYCIPAYTLLYPEGYSIGSLSNLKQKVDEGFILTGNTYKRDLSQMENVESTETKVFIFRCPECNGYGQLNEKAEEILCPSCDESFPWKDEYILSDEEVKKLFGQSPTDNNNNNEENNNNNNNNSDSDEEKSKKKNNSDSDSDSDSDEQERRREEERRRQREEEEERKRRLQQQQQQEEEEENSDNDKPKPKENSDSEKEEKPVVVEDVQVKEENEENEGGKKKKHKHHHKKDKKEKEEEEEKEEKPKTPTPKNDDNEKPKEEEETNNNNNEDGKPKKHKKKHHKKDDNNNNGENEGVKITIEVKEETKPKENNDENKVQLPSTSQYKVKCPDCQEITVFDEKPEYLDCSCGTSVEVQDSMLV